MERLLQEPARFHRTGCRENREGTAGKNHGIIGIQQFREDDSEGMSRLACHSAGNGAWPVVSAGDDFRYAQTRFLGDVGLPLQHAGYGGNGNTRFFRDIINGTRKPAPCGLPR